MTKTVLTLAAVSALTLGVAACETINPNSPTNRAPGTYESTSKSTNASGTTTKTKQTTHVYEDSSGNKKAVVKTDTTSDPKGLFNRSTSTSTKSYN